MFTKAASNFYESLSQSRKDPETTCPVSFETVEESNRYFDWISMPVEQGVITNYHISTIKRLIELKQGDPLRNYVSVKFLKTRVEHIEAMDEKTRNLTVDELNPQKCFDEALDSWKNNNETIHDGMLIPFELTITLFHQITAVEAVLLLKGKEHGTFLLRISDKANVDSTGSCAIFTVSYIEENRVYHIRFAYLHGIGIYMITPGIPNTPCTRIINMDVLKRSKFNEMLLYLRYEPPLFACLTDLLHHLHTIQFIQLGKMTLPIIP